MAANNLVVHGARCVLCVDGNPVGIFSSVSYGVNYSNAPIYILGRSGAAEIAMTGMDVVTVQAHGWRVIGHGPFATGPNDIGMPQLSEILTKGAISLSILDKVATDNPSAGKLIMQVDNCRVVGFQTTLASRNPQDLQITFVGTVFSDEEGAQGEASFAQSLPS